MKAFLLPSAAALALAGAVGTASAADLARRPPPPPPTKAPFVVPAYNWTGAYIGINAGYGFGRSKWDGLPASFDVKGGMAGGQLGYNWQFGQFVYGVEGDGDWSDLRGTANLANCNRLCRHRQDECRLDGRRRSRIRPLGPVDRESRVPLRRSRQGRLQRGLRLSGRR